MEEVWKDIDGYEGLYQVSNLGRVKRLARSNGKRYLNEMLLKPQNKKGYYQVNLYKNKKMKSYQIHRIVAKKFIDNPYNKKEVNHKNGIKTDNRVKNLEWVTPKENMEHAWRTGLKKPYKGPKVNGTRTRIKIAQYTLEGNLLKTWNGLREIEKKLGVNYSSIVNCCRGRILSSHGYKWKYVK